MGGRTVYAQRLDATEAAAGGVVVLAHRSFWGGELAVARRGGGQGRFALTVAGGSYDGRAGVRLGAATQFVLKPAERRGTTLYGGLGITFAGGRATHGSGYLTALVGLETTPGRGGGWYGELGLAGGVRVAAGRRWRRFPAWWK